MNQVRMSVVIGAVAVAAILGGVWLGMAEPRSDTTTNDVASKGLLLGVPVCGENRSPAAFVATLQPHTSAGDLTAIGLQVMTLAKQAPGAANQGSGRIVIGLARRDGSSVDVSNLAADSALDRVGVLYAQSERKELLSCDYQLADSPGASVVRDRAAKLLQASGLVSGKVLGSDTTIWTVSDDPLVDGGLIVCAQVLGARINAETEPEGLYGLDRFVVVLDPKGSAVEIGPADW